MKANRLIMIGLIAASLLAGCKKKDDNTTNSHLNMDGISFSASTEQHDRNTRTYLEGEDIKWMNGDKILVTNSANQQGEFEVTGGIGTTNGTFHSANDFDHAPEYNAAYPYSVASISGTTATFTMSGTQTITATGTFANGAMPMVAHSDDETLNFRNVFGGLSLPIKGAGISVTKIVLTSSNTNEVLWGTFNADCTSSDPNPTNISGGTNVLELVCNPAVELQGAQSQDFVFMIPEGTLQSGFTFAVYSTGTEPVYSKPVNVPNGNFSTTENLINRSRIRKVNTDINIEAALEVETYSPTFISYDKAWMGGTVTGGTPTECGVIYATYDALSGNPDNLVLSDDFYKVEMTPSGTAYNDWANELTKNTVYFVKAYAISASGDPYYGDPIPFATRRDYVNDCGGMLQGKFSVSSSNKISFAMGNLQHKNVGNVWRYAEYQFEFVGGNDVNQGVNLGNVYIDGEDPIETRQKCNNYAAQTDQQNSEEWYDYFAWGTSGQYNGADYNEPWRRVRTDIPYPGEPFYNNDNSQNVHFYIFGSMDYDLTGTTADWAVNNIINGNASGRYTGSVAEWQYLTKERITPCTVNNVPSARFAFAQLTVRKGSEINGIFLFPDDFVWPDLVRRQPSLVNEEYTYGGDPNHKYNWNLPAENKFTEAQWSLLEHNDLVFLPAAGCYGITGTVEWTNGGGRYWTSNHRVPEYASGNPYSGAYDFAFSPAHTPGVEGIVNPYGADERYIGFSVRFMIPNNP